MTAPPSDTATIAARQSRLVELLAEGKSQTEAAEILRSEGHPASEPTITRDVRELKVGWTETTIRDFSVSQDGQLARITDKWTLIENDASMSGAEKHAAWARWMRLEMDLLGTSAPTKSIQAHVSSAKLDPLYLAVRSVLQDLEEDDQLAGLELLRQFAKTKRKPMTIDLAAVPQLTDGDSQNG